MLQHTPEAPRWDLAHQISVNVGPWPVRRRTEAGLARQAGLQAVEWWGVGAVHALHRGAALSSREDVTPVGHCKWQMSAVAGRRWVLCARLVQQ